MYSIVFVWGYQAANYASHGVSMLDPKGIPCLPACGHIGGDLSVARSVLQLWSAGKDEARVHVWIPAQWRSLDACVE